MLKIPEKVVELREVNKGPRVWPVEVKYQQPGGEARVRLGDSPFVLGKRGPFLPESLPAPPL